MKRLYTPLSGPKVPALSGTAAEEQREWVIFDERLDQYEHSIRDVNTSVEESERRKALFEISRARLALLIEFNKTWQAQEE